MAVPVRLPMSTMIAGQNDLAHVVLRCSFMPAPTLKIKLLQD
jgi:hypothetical protein